MASEDWGSVSSLVQSGEDWSKVSSPFNEQEKPKPESAVGAILRQGLAGTKVELPKMLGQALQYTGDPGDARYALGKEIANAAEARGKLPENAPIDESQHNWLTNALAGGARMIPQSLAPAAAIGAAAAAVPASVTAAIPAGALLLGGAALSSLPTAMSQGQETLDKGLAAGVSPEESLKAARLNALIEGGGETLGTAAMGKVFGLGSKVLTKAKTPGDVLKNAVDPAIVKPWAKSVAQAYPTEILTEMGQNAGETAVENTYGIDKQNTPWEAAKEAVAPTFGMTTILAPFGLAGHAANSMQAKAAAKTLSSPESPADDRASVAMNLYNEMKGVDQEAADVFRDNAIRAISNRRAFTLDETALAPYDATAETAQMNALNADLGGAQFNYENTIPSEQLALPPGVITVPNNAGGETVVDSSNGPISSAAVTAVTNSTLAEDVASGMPLKGYSPEQAKEELASRPDADRYEIKPHPVSGDRGRVAIVPKSAQALAEIDAKASAGNEAMARNEQLAAEEDSRKQSIQTAKDVQSLQKQVIDMHRSAAAIEKSITLNTSPQDVAIAREQAADLRSQAKTLNEQIKEIANAPQMATTSGQGSGGIAGGSTGNTQAVGGVDGGRGGSAGSSVSGRGADISMGDASVSDAALDELSPSPVQPMSEMPAMQAIAQQRAQQATQQADVRAQQLAQEEGTVAEQAPPTVKVPRPMKVGGLRAAKYSDEQLQAVVDNANVPATSRRAAAAEIAWRQAEAEAAAQNEIAQSTGKMSRQRAAVPLALYTDGVEGQEIPAAAVPNGNEAFQYAIGKTEEGGQVAVFRRRADERGTYGGWRWEADANRVAKLSRQRAGESPADYQYRMAAEKNAAKVQRQQQPQTATEVEDIAAVRRAIKDPKAEVTIVAEESMPDMDKAAPRQVSKQSATFLRHVAKTFGKEIVFVDGMESDGFYQSGNKIYLLTKSSVHHVRVLGHEMLHAMKRQNRASYDKLLKAVSEIATDAQLTGQFKDYFAMDAKMNQKTDAEIAEWLTDPANREMILEEMMADLSGNRWAESSFWESVFTKIDAKYGSEQAKGIIAKLRLALVNALNKLMSLVKGGQFKVDARVAEHLESIREALATGFADYAKAVKDKQVSEDGVGAVKFSKAKNDVAEDEETDAVSEGARVADVLKAEPDQKVDPNEVPEFKFSDHVGRQMFATIADRTAAGGVFNGIDGAETGNIPLQGGPGFPMLSRNYENGIIWANDGKAITSKKANIIAKHGKPLMAVSLGSFDMHSSNATAATAYLKTVESYIRNKRIEASALSEVTDTVRTLKLPKEYRQDELAEFPGFDNLDALDAFINNASFPSRAAIVKELGKARSESIGLPSSDKLLRSLADSKYAGARHFDTVLILEPSDQDTFIKLGDEGTNPHLSYSYGVKGKVVGKLSTPINAREIWADWYESKYQEKIAEKQMMRDVYLGNKTIDDLAGMVKREDYRNNSLYKQAVNSLVGAYEKLVTGAKNKSKLQNLVDGNFDSLINMDRSFGMSSPVVEITKGMADRLDAIANKPTPNASTVKAALSFINNEWHTSDESVKDGGVSAADFARELRQSDYSATLDLYSEEQLKNATRGWEWGTNEKGKKVKVPLQKMKLYRLGDQRIQFALKSGKPFTYGVEVDGLSDNEVTLVSVVNNEPGVSGIAGPAIMTKAIEEGVTFLDCYSVPSKEYPNGFLPTLYAEYGFREVARVPFDEQYLTNDHKYAWRKFGWKDSDPLPKIALMKWEGNESDRQGIQQRYLEEGGASLRKLSVRAGSAAGTYADELARKKARRTGRKGDSASGDRGIQDAANRASMASRAFSTIEQVKGLDADQLRNLGVKLSPARSDASSDERTGGLAASGVGEVPSYGTASAGSVKATGIHYSGSERSNLDGRYYGTGAKGREADRVLSAQDKRIRERIYFYVDSGKGITPEQGVGSIPHSVNLNNLYDGNADTFVQANVSRELKGNDWMSAFESAVIDAGFDGYISDFGAQRAVVLIGRHSVPVAAGKSTVASPQKPQAQSKRTDLPMGKMTGAEWKKIEPRATDLEDDKSYYRDDIKFSPARLTDERIDRLMSQYAYTMDDKKTKAYIGWVKPDDFLAATTPVEQRKRLEFEAEPLDQEKMRRQTQELRLDGEIEDGVFNTLGHEGRHRMMALRNAGVDRVPVTFYLYNGAKRDPIDSIPIRAQSWGRQTNAIKAESGFVGVNLTPINYENLDKIKSEFGGDADIRFSPPRWYFSPLEKAFESAPDKVFGQAAQVKLWLAGNKSKLGLKDDEIFWTGINDYLDLMGKQKVSKADVLGYLARSGVQVEEVMKGVPGYDENDPQLPVGSGLDVINATDGATGYEVTARNGRVIGRGKTEADAIADAYSGNPEYWEGAEATKFGQYTLPGGENYRELLLTLPAAQKPDITASQEEKDAWRTKADKEYRSGHWEEPNILAHIRMNDRTDADGNKVLFIEEVQSDWGQEGKKKGFVSDGKLPAGWSVEEVKISQYATRWAVFDNSKTQVGTYAETKEEAIKSATTRNGFTGGTPSAPFVTDTKAWLGLSIKRIMAYAAANGYDKVAFINGEQSADRYDLSKQISYISYAHDNGMVRVQAVGKNGQVIFNDKKKPDELEDVVGKEVAQKIIDRNGDRSLAALWPDWSGPHYRLSGLDLKVGGEGMKAFYDRIVPQVVSDQLKKVGGKMEVVRITLNENLRSRVAPADVGTKEDDNGFWVGSKGKAWEDQQAFTVTPKMSEPLPLFSTRRQTETPEFKAWFGDSKVVDAKGKPLMVYHGTARDDFTEFDTDHKKSGTPSGYAIVEYLGSAFSVSAEVANSFIVFNQTSDIAAEKKLDKGSYRLPDKARILPVYLAISNPAKFKSLNDLASTVLDETGKGGKEGAEIFRQKLIDKGYDGIEFSEGMMWKPMSKRKAAYIAFDPNQIKSAIGNNGQFSPTDPDIRRSTRRQTETPEFKAWFGDSKVVDADGNPLVVYHGTASDFSVFDVESPDKFDSGWLGRGFYFTTSKSTAGDYAVFREKGNAESNIMPVYLSISNPLKLRISMKNTKSQEMALALNVDLKKQLAYDKEDAEFLLDAAIEQGYDGVTFEYTDGSKEIVAFSPTQIKSAIGNNGQFSPTDPDIRRSPARSAATGQPIIASWASPEISSFDNIVRQLQDKLIDTKRVVDAIRGAGKAISDVIDPYLQEILYHGRAAKKTQDFAEQELRPMLQAMQMRKVTMQEIEDYLWAQHAPERNAQNAKAGIQDGSGLTDGEARDILAGRAVTKNGRTIQLNAAKMQDYRDMAAKVKAINDKTLDELVAYGLETRATVDQWKRTYQNYVPLMRDMSDDNYAGANNRGLGKGFSVSGSASKRAIGSQRGVIDIMANIAMQRERAITRGERNKVSQATYGLALAAPNPDFWLPIDPAANRNPASIAKLQQDLIKLGMNPIDAQNVAQEPVQTYIDPNTGKAATRINPALRNRDNVLAVRINGEDKFIFFSSNDRAKAMVTNLKNLDDDQLGGFLQASAKITRWFASVNTQYNPVFGMVNGIRDFGGAMLNLTSTPLAGQQARVAKYGWDALRGIYSDLRDHRAGRKPSSAWAQEFEEFASNGGQTGYRDMFNTADDRTKALQKELERMASGDVKKWTSIGENHPVFAWLSDYNTAIENAFRLAAYKVAKENGMTQARAAQLAKNLTVNFNKKGLAATQTGALYAFFNAAVQGTARIGETLLQHNGNPSDYKNIRLSKTGKQIVLGGITLGVMQALLGAMAGWDDDEPKQFQRERNLIIPIPGSDKYVSIPLPLGFHVLPNLGRITTEFMLSGFKNPGKRLTDLLGVMAEAFNPIGNAGMSLQTIAPTFADPLVALATNKDWNGQSIAREDFNRNKPTPGWSRTKDTASPWGKTLAYALNYVSGGGEYGKGMISPTPDQIDYLTGQVFGGVGREIIKLATSAKTVTSGEELPMYKVPIAGRFIGETTGVGPESGRFYDNLERIGAHDFPLKKMKEERDLAGLRDYLNENPEAKLIKMADKAQRDISDLRMRKRKTDDPDRVKSIESMISLRMKSFNNQVRNLQERSG